MLHVVAVGKMQLDSQRPQQLLVIDEHHSTIVHHIRNGLHVIMRLIRLWNGSPYCCEDYNIVLPCNSCPSSHVSLCILSNAMLLMGGVGLLGDIVGGFRV